MMLATGVPLLNLFQEYDFRSYVSVLTISGGGSANELLPASCLGFEKTSFSGMSLCLIS
jgi:hypothetical protein